MTNAIHSTINLDEEQLAMIQARTPLPEFGRSTPATLKAQLKQAQQLDDRDLAYNALLRFASSYGGCTDIDRTLYAWLHEIRPDM